jgi:hypothetical protein
LRKRKFFSLAEVNQAISELLGRLNQRPFRKRPGNRATLFTQLDRPALVHGAHRLELQGESMRKKKGGRGGQDGE